MKFNNILSETLNNITTITINRPTKLNALNKETIQELHLAFRNAEENSNTKVIIITGSGQKAFVAGADITEFVGKNSKDIKIQFTDNGVEAIWSLSKPTIAMVDGFALGGGCEVACSCDIRIASSRSKFGTPEINLGLIPGYGATQRLMKLLGYGKTMELVMTGEMIGAEEAYRIGLVNHVVEPEELMEVTMNMAKTIASKSSNTLAVAKSTIRTSLEVGLEQGVAIEADAFASLFDSEDKEIGVQAFLNRETPQWKHK